MVLQAAWILSWLPGAGASQVLAYALLPASAVMLLLTGRVPIWKPAIPILAAPLLLSGIAAILNPGEFHSINLFLALVTYSSLIWLLPRPRLQGGAYWALVSLVAWLSMGETVLALSQLLVRTGSIHFTGMAAGDFAVGTLLGNSHLFVVKMIIQVVVLTIAYANGRRSTVVQLGIAASLLGVALGSALFATVLAIGAVLLSLLLVIPRRYRFSTRRVARWILITAFGLGGLIVLFLTLQMSNVRYVERVLGETPKIVSSAWSRNPTDSFGKVVGMVRTGHLLVDHLRLLLIGTGMGEYSSRAALILSGGYLRSQGRIPVSMSTYTRTDILPLWNRSIWSKKYAQGVLNQPFNSLQAILGESGVIGVAILALLLAFIWKRTSVSFDASAEERVAKATARVGVIVAIALLLSDNWLEYPQFVVPVLVLVAYSRIGRRRSGS